MALAYHYRAQTIWESILQRSSSINFRFVLDRFVSLRTTSICVLQLKLRYREEANLQRN